MAFCSKCQVQLDREIWSICVSGGKSYFYCSWDCYNEYSRHHTDCRFCGEKVEKKLIRKHLKKCPKKLDRIGQLEARVKALEAKIQSIEASTQ